MEKLTYYFKRSKYNISRHSFRKGYKFIVYYRDMPLAEIRKSHRKYKDLLYWWNDKHRTKLIGFIRHTINRAIKDVLVAGLSCSICGEKDSRLFDLDHLGDKKFNVAEMMSRSTPEDFLAEIKKTQILCVKCHRLKSLSSAHSHTTRPHFTLHREAKSTVYQLIKHLGGN